MFPTSVKTEETRTRPATTTSLGHRNHFEFKDEYPVTQEKVKILK